MRLECEGKTNEARLIAQTGFMHIPMEYVKNQALGRLPWLAAFLRRSLRLRPRMPMMDSFT